MEEEEATVDLSENAAGASYPEAVPVNPQGTEITNTPVVVVNGQEISTAYFQARVRLAQRNLVNQYRSLEEAIADDSKGSDLREQVQSRLNSIAQQLADPLFVGSSILDLLIEEKLLAQEAARRGIEVSEDEIDTFMEERLGFFGEQQAATPESSVDATPNPTATPDTQELYERNLEAYLTNVGAYGIDEATLRAEARAILLRDRLEADFEGDVEKRQEQVWARHILVEDEQAAADLLTRIENGEEWGDLAADFSIDTSNKDQGGNLNWFGRGRMVESFEEAAFAGEIGEIVGPIETNFGWHLIEILGHELRPLDDLYFQLTVSRALDAWIEGVREIAQIELMENWLDHVPSAAPILEP